MWPFLIWAIQPPYSWGDIVGIRGTGINSQLHIKVKLNKSEKQNTPYLRAKNELQPAVGHASS